jgi:hypothetical protein
MNGDRIAMSARERDRLKVSKTRRGEMAPVSKTRRGELEGQRTQAEAARLMILCVRQVRRLQRRLEKEGDAGVIHRLRGRPSNHRHKETLRRQAVAIYRRDMPDFSLTMASEKLAARQVPVPARTLRDGLSAEGLWQPKYPRDRPRSWWLPSGVLRRVSPGRRQPPRLAGGPRAAEGAGGEDRRCHQQGHRPLLSRRDDRGVHEPSVALPRAARSDGGDVRGSGPRTTTPTIRSPRSRSFHGPWRNSASHGSWPTVRRRRAGSRGSFRRPRTGWSKGVTAGQGNHPRGGQRGPSEDVPAVVQPRVHRQAGQPERCAPTARSLDAAGEHPEFPGKAEGR